MKNKILEIGKVVNTHGIRGELKIQPWCDDPAIYSELEYIYIDGKRYDIEKARFHKNCEIVAVKGISDINEAELLKNKIVTVEREMLGELPEGRYYIVDLIGLSVRTDDGREIGFIEDVFNTGSNDIYQVARKNKKPALIPAIPDVVKEVDIESGCVLITPMKGMIDDEI